MDRSDAALIPAETAWLTDAGAQTVCRVLSDGGHQIFFVGGCVRNALLGATVSDIDLATDAAPDRVIKLAEAAGLKAVPTGIAHGTVTLIVGDTPYEVTTFRRDVQTDGRRAVVAYSHDIKEDAQRRDFTMNALYATPEGRVVDPLGGIADLRTRRIRFIDDATARIREDYLRVLRYFRFHAWYGDSADGFDPDALSAIGENIAGLETLSAERIGAEIRKLLQAPDPVFALSGMQQTGVLGAILPGSDTRLVAPVVHFESMQKWRRDWRTRLAALGGIDSVDRLRLSKADARKLIAIRDAAFAGPTLPEIAFRDGAGIARGAALLRAALAEQMPDPNLSATIETAANATFPVAAADLMPEFDGKALGRRLREIEQMWIDSGFTLTREQLLG